MFSVVILVEGARSMEYASPVFDVNGTAAAAAAAVLGVCALVACWAGKNKEEEHPTFAHEEVDDRRVTDKLCCGVFILWCIATVVAANAVIKE